MEYISHRTIKLTEEEAIELASELDDIGFGADSLDGKPQPNEKWPLLGELADLMLGGI